MTKQPNKPTQYTQADVQRLAAAGKHADIDRYRLAGHLDDLLGIVRHYPPKQGQWSSADVSALTAERRHVEIAAARAAGQLDDVLRGTDPDAA
jgi:hypothetical protein